MLRTPLLLPFTLPGQTQSAGTAIVQLVPPYMSPSGGPFLYSGGSPKKFGPARTIATTVAYTTGATAHAIYLARPLNWTTVNGAVAKNTTTVVLTADPGLYSANYNYSNPASLSAQIADNGIAANDYVAVQLTDGTWHVSKVGSVSSLTLTLSTATPNVTGGGIADGAVLYFFGNITSDKDPATALANANTTIATNQTRDVTWSDSTAGIVAGLHPGDPLLFYSANGTNAGTLEWISGYHLPAAV